MHKDGFIYASNILVNTAQELSRPVSDCPLQPETFAVIVPGRERFSFIFFSLSGAFFSFPLFQAPFFLFRFFGRLFSFPFFRAPFSFSVFSGARFFLRFFGRPFFFSVFSGAPFSFPFFRAPFFFFAFFRAPVFSSVFPGARTNSRSDVLFPVIFLLFLPAGHHLSVKFLYR